jgi:hypothetical protein
VHVEEMLSNQRSRSIVRFRGPLHDIVVQVRPESADATERGESEREIWFLTRAFKQRDPEARRAVTAILRCLGGFLAHDVGAFDSGSPLADALADELLLAARLGYVVARPRVTRSVVVPVDLPEEEVLGPLSEEEKPPAKLTWIEIVLVGDDGVGIADIRYSVKTPDGDERQGRLDARGRALIGSLHEGQCKVSFPDLDEESWEFVTSAA